MSVLYFLLSTIKKNCFLFNFNFQSISVVFYKEFSPQIAQALASVKGVGLIRGNDSLRENVHNKHHYNKG